MRKFRLINGIGWGGYVQGQVYDGEHKREKDNYTVEYFATKGQYKNDWEEVFEEQFVRGELVEVKNNGFVGWKKRIYVTTIEGSTAPYICVDNGGSLDEPFDTTKWEQIRKIKAAYKVTREEIGKLLGTDNFEIE